jgi:hypothetical protein
MKKLEEDGQVKLSVSGHYERTVKGDKTAETAHSASGDDANGERKRPPRRCNGGTVLGGKYDKTGRSK